MKFFTGCVAAAALALVASAAGAADGAAPGPYVAVSDFDGPYGPAEAAPPPPPRYGYRYEERGPALLPATEVYTVLRDNGFAPLGIPRLRGAVYTIAVIDRRGDDGRLVIDARDGRILRFMPAADAYGMALPYEEHAAAPYGPQSALPQPTAIRGWPPRPPASIPHVATRAVPLPKAAPPRPVARRRSPPSSQPSLRRRRNRSRRSPRSKRPPRSPPIRRKPSPQRSARPSPHTASPPTRNVRSRTRRLSKAV